MGIEVYLVTLLELLLLAYYAFRDGSPQLNLLLGSNINSFTLNLKQNTETPSPTLNKMLRHHRQLMAETPTWTSQVLPILPNGRSGPRSFAWALPTEYTEPKTKSVSGFTRTKSMFSCVNF